MTAIITPEHVLIFVPGRPPSWNQYWRGKHWGQRRREKRSIQDLVVAIIRKAVDTVPWVRTPVAIQALVMYTSRKNVLDVDNVCLKPYIDAFVAVGLIPDDHPDYVRSVTVVVRIHEDPPIGVKEGVYLFITPHVPQIELGKEGDIGG